MPLLNFTIQDAREAYACFFPELEHDLEIELVWITLNLLL